MTSELNYIAALQRIDDLARKAERARLARLASKRGAAKRRRVPLRLGRRGPRRPIAAADTP
jgi:hypothetical protein